jgi:hypothetical protein
MSRFQDEKHFTSWMGLAPSRDISGGKVVGSGAPRNLSENAWIGNWRVFNPKPKPKGSRWFPQQNPAEINGPKRPAKSRP